MYGSADADRGYARCTQGVYRVVYARVVYLLLYPGGVYTGVYLPLSLLPSERGFSARVNLLKVDKCAETSETAQISGFNFILRFMPD